MKKYFFTALATLCVSMTVVSAADAAFLGWQCKDKAALTAGIADTNVRADHRAAYAVLLDKLNNPAKYDTAVKYLAATEDIVIKYAPFEYSQTVHSVTCTIQHCNARDFDAAGYAYAVKNDCFYAKWYLVSNVDIGLTRVELAGKLARMLVDNPTNDVRWTKAAVARYTELSVALPEATAIADLKAMLAVYYPKSVDNATTWKPVYDRITAALYARGVQITK